MEPRTRTGAFLNEFHDRLQKELLMSAPLPSFVALLFVASVSGVANGQALPPNSKGHQRLPNLDIQSGCRYVASNDVNKTSNYSGCMQEEKQARAQLEKDWVNYPASMHEQCLHLVTPPALPSYVTLQECLTMARDAKKLPGNPAAIVNNGKK